MCIKEEMNPWMNLLPGHRLWTWGL